MAIAQLDLKEKRINRFNTVTEAARMTGVSYSSISLCLNGKRETAGGFTWRYVGGLAKIKKIDLFCQGCSDRIVGKDKFIVCPNCLERTKDNG